MKEGGREENVRGRSDSEIKSSCRSEEFAALVWISGSLNDGKCVVM